MKTHKEVFGRPIIALKKSVKRMTRSKVINKKRPLCGWDVRVKPEW